MLVAGGATNVTTYFKMRLTADGTGATGLTATNFDLQYTRSGAAAAAKVDATLNGNGVGGAHSDSTVIEVDATSSPGLYRIDWVDAAFAAGVREVILTVKVATAFTEDLRVEIDGEVNVVEWAGTDVATPTVGGVPEVDVTHWIGTAAATPTTAGVPEVDTTHVSGTLQTAGDLAAKLDGIGAGTGASLNFSNEGDNVDTAIKSISFDGTETAGTNASVNTEDASWHQIDDAGGNIDIVYQFDVGGGRTATELSWKGRLTMNDTLLVKVYNGSTWDTVGNIIGASNSAPSDVDDNATEVFPLLSTHTGTSADIGKVFVRLECVAQSAPTLYTDLLLVSAVNIGQTVGYQDGAIWVDSNGTAGSEAFVNGVADKPCTLWSDALLLSTSVGLKRFRIAAGDTVQLTADSTGFQIIGNGEYTLDLNGQTVTNIVTMLAKISGSGTGSGVHMDFGHVQPGASIPAGDYHRCGFSGTSGSKVTESGTGQYIFHSCYSEVAGSGTPFFDFSGAGGAVGINNRGWTGGVDWVLDSNCTLSHEVLAGGGTTVACAGADVEIRGITRSLTLSMTGTETVQFVGVTGPVSLSGTTTAAVKLYGVSGTVTDGTSAAVVTNKAVSLDTINTEADTAINDAALATAAAIGTPIDFGGGESTISQNLQDLADNGTATFDRSTDSLQAIRDHVADGTNLTEAGGTGDHLTALATAANLATVDTNIDSMLTILPQKNVALSNIQILMVDTTNQDPATGLTVTGTRSIDGGAYAGVTGTIAEVGKGTYQFDASQADMNGNIIMFVFVATGAEDAFLEIVTRT